MKGINIKEIEIETWGSTDLEAMKELRSMLNRIALFLGGDKSDGGFMAMQLITQLALKVNEDVKAAEPKEK